MQVTNPTLTSSSNIVTTYGISTTSQEVHRALRARLVSSSERLQLYRPELGPLSSEMRSDSEAAVVVVPTIAPEIVPEVSREAEAAIESPEEDPLEDDSSGDDTLKAAGPLAVQAVPPPLQIVPALPALPRIVPDEEKMVERYIWGLPDSIQQNVTSSKPTRLQDAIRLANSLMDQKVRANSARQTKNKSRWEITQGNNHVQQPPPKRQNVTNAYTAGPGEKKVYPGSLTS
nr:reverse transcriptase domain-containing protein [Tanacetum cinerariifolium]